MDPRAFAMNADEALLNNPPALSTNIPPTWTTILTPITSLSPTRKLLLAIFVSTLILLNVCFFRLATVLMRDPICRRPPPSPENPSHLLIVLGSGGHTAEMFNILSQYDRLQLDWTQRTYVVSSGDDFSASKAKNFEAEMSSNLRKSGLLSRPPDPSGTDQVGESVEVGYDIVTVNRARRVHQSLLTTPISSLRCLWDCIKMLRGTHQDFQPQPASLSPPDLIITNGPGTGVIVVLASIILAFFGFAGPSASLPRSKKVMRHASKIPSPSTTPDQSIEGDALRQSGQMHTIFIESWARVKTLSLSGWLLKPFVDRFLVQWPQLAEKEGQGGRLEFVGSLVT